MRRLSPLLVAGLLAATGLVATTTAAAADQRPPKVTIVERGASPRSELRYTLTAGSEQLTTFRMLTRVGQQVGDGPAQSGTSPALTLDLRTTVTSVAPDGVVTATYVYEAIDVADESAADAAVAERVRDQIEPIIGLVGTFTMTDQGQVLSANVDIPPDADETLTSLIEQLSTQATSLAVPFPEGAVGRGGRWKATTTATVGGITFDQTAEYTVESLKGDRIELSSTVVQNADRQTFTDPTSGDDVELLSSKGTGDGDSVLRLDGVLPTKGDAHVQVRQKLRADGQRISQTVTTHIFINQD